MALLDGIRVVEAASMVLVPSAASMLADFGADVIKIEPPPGDENRRLHELPAMPDSEIAYSFLMDNRSKRGIVLDLKQPDGQAVLHRLVDRADAPRNGRLVVPLDHPRFGRLHTVDSPITVAGEPKTPARAAPELGEDTVAVLTELDYSPAAIADLLARGVAVGVSAPR
jgi:crotonobetainyl-CoA:carnitine CoA-transferase CaiB-like acyl-CoA transferase